MAEKMLLIPREDGLLEPISEKALSWVRDQSKSGQRVAAEVSKVTRTSLQNRFLNGWIYGQLCKQLNDAGIRAGWALWTRDTIHAAMREVFLVEYSFMLNGNEVKAYKSTAQMTTAELSEFVQNIREFAYETWCISIPDPISGYWAEVLRDIGD